MPTHYDNCVSHTIPKLQPLSSHASDHALALQPWYKFMSAKYANELCEHGRILLSNLFYYRRDENLAAGIRDLEDGQYSYDAFVEIGVQINYETNEVGDSYSDVRFLGSEHIADAFVFCASETADAEVRAEFSGYDSVVEISNPKLFIATVAECLVAKGISNGAHVVNRCRYHDFPVHEPLFLQGIYPAFVKHRKFRQQAEIRVLWEASPLPQRTQIEDKRLAGACKLLSG